jgi:single-strand DNA-binding protein
MGNLNKVFLIGRLGQDPEIRVTPAGKTVVNVSLATTEYYKDRSGNKLEKTEWHRLVVWEKIGDIVANYCKKGSQIYFEGSLQTRDWQDKDGNNRYTTEIVVRSVQLLDSKPQEETLQVKKSDKPWAEDNIPFKMDVESIEEDDIPF